MKNWLSPVTLENEHVQLIPLDKAHRAALINAASDGKLWEYWYTSVPSEATVDTYLEVALAEQQAGLALPFAVFSKADQKIIGSTRFCNAEPSNRRVEIGYTWYSKSYQRTAVNTSCKLLLLQHAFENLDAIAVEFRTHWFNYHSRAAILRIGAKQDGVLRNHRFDKEGNIRDTVVFSIIQSEWNVVKRSLAFRLGR